MQGTRADQCRPTIGTEVGGIPTVETLGTGVDETAVRGIVLREHTTPPNAGSALSSAVDQVQPGNLVAVAYRNKVLMRNNGTVAAARGGIVYVVVNTAGGQEVGMARADDDGANAIAMSITRALTSTGLRARSSARSRQLSSCASGTCRR